MSSKREDIQEAIQYLDDIVCEATRVGADRVELERMPLGLDLNFFIEGSSIGLLLKDAALEEALFGLIIEQAGLAERAKGKMDWEALGENRRITVDQYDAFGEVCFRLKFAQRRRRAAKSGG